jgi:hypothetical protein
MVRGKKLAAKMREELARQEAAGTRRPAAVHCEKCDVWYSPDLAHEAKKHVNH